MAILPCSALDCDRTRKAKGYCNMHYQRWITHGFLEKPVETFTCDHCGETKTQDKRGPKPRYCSLKCGQLSHWAKNGERIGAEKAAENARKRALTVKACNFCAEKFTPENSLAQKFCSVTCKNSAHRDSSKKSCTEPDCDRPMRAKGLCSMHWRRKAREDGRETAEGWTERRKANYQKRRAQKLSLPSESVRPVDVYERDEWVCGICSDPVDRNLSYPDPMSPSLDHVIPLSLGGHHVMENLALSHWICNVRKGNRVEADAMSA